MFSDLPSYYWELLEQPSRLTPPGMRILLQQIILPGHMPVPTHIEARFRAAMFH